MTPIQKWCPRCKKFKLAGEFFPNKSTKSGLGGWCKECDGKKAREQYLQRKQNSVTPTVDTKLCSHCNQNKSASEFHLSKVSKDGLLNCCKTCTGIRSRMYKKQRKDLIPKMPASGLKTCTKCGWEQPIAEFHACRNRKDGLLNYCRTCCKENNKGKHRKRKYGISEEEYQTMLAEQHGVCHLCKKPETMQHMGKTFPLVIDHSHSPSQKIRKLLCNSCNLLVGSIERALLTPGLLKKVREYINEHVD